MRPRAPRAARDPVAILAPAIEALTGGPHNAAQLQRFQRYLELLLAWNRTHRLTGIRAPEAIARELFQDSLLYLARLPPGPLRMVDIGAGAGIPGVPLHIVRPEISLTLIDSRRKPVSFLASLKRELALTDVEILEGRAEDLVGHRPGLSEAFDVATARLVGLHLLPTAMRYLKPGGLFIASGPPPHKARTAPRVGIPARWETVPFPALGISRTFLLSHKPT